jgi:hypothetical protein
LKYAFHKKREILAHSFIMENREKRRERAGRDEKRRKIRIGAFLNE